MAGFFHNFATGLRIAACARQVCVEVEDLTALEGAHLALMTSLFRNRMLNVGVPDSSTTIGEVVQRPGAYRQEICYSAFCLLQAIREASRAKVRSYASFGVQPSPNIMRHTELCDLSLSLLMSTVGVGYRPSTLATVRYSWTRVASFSPGPSDVELIMSMPEHLINDYFDTPLKSEQWLDMSRKSPEFLNNFQVP